MAELVTKLAPQPALPPGDRMLADELQLSVLPSRAIVQLQVSARSLKTIANVRIGDRELASPLNCATGNDPANCRIAPDTWLLHSSRHEPRELEAMVAKACVRRSCAVTDLSDGLVMLALEGPRAVDVLARGCGLDLGGAACGIGFCARTRFAQLPVVLRHAAMQRFELIVDRSTAQYLFDWIADAAAALG